MLLELILDVLEMAPGGLSETTSWLSWLGTLFRTLSVPNICSEHCLRTTPRTTRTTPRTTRITSRTIRTTPISSPPLGGLLICMVLMVLEVILVFLGVVLVVLEVVLV